MSPRPTLALLAAAAALLAAPARAAARPDTATVHGPGRGLSLLVTPGAPGRHPALLLVHEWWGLNEFARERAMTLAREGYVVLVVDLHGGRRTTTDPKEAAALAGAYYADRMKFRTALSAALDTLRARRDVDTARIGALGFCFGGTAVLEAARAGLPLRAVASFHGGLKTDSPARPGAVRGRILVLHGGADPNVPMDEVAAFAREMEASRTRYAIEIYGNAVHAFMNPAAGNDPSKGAAHDPAAARAAWQAFERFLVQTGMKHRARLLEPRSSPFPRSQAGTRHFRENRSGAP